MQGSHLKQADYNVSYNIFCIIGAVISFNIASVSALVPSIAKSLGRPEFEVGSIIWAYMIPYGISALFYGPLSRRLGIKKLLFFCLGLFSVFSFLSGFAGSLGVLFFFRFLVGVFAAAMIPLTLIFISHTVNVDARGKAVGKFFSITFISSLIGLFLSGIIEWRFIFFIPATAGFFVIFAIMVSSPCLEIKAEGLSSQYFGALRNRKVLRVFLYIFIVSFLYHLVRQWLGVYFSYKYALAQFLISFLLTLESVSGVFGELIGGFLADKKGRVLTLKKGALFMAAAILFLSFSGNIWFLAVCMVVWGLGWTINHSGLCTYLTDMPKPYLREVSSLNSSVRFISGGLGAAMGGVLMQKSFSATFIGVGVLIFLTALFSNRILKA